MARKKEVEEVRRRRRSEQSFGELLAREV